jgi:hypothetical protein
MNSTVNINWENQGQKYNTLIDGDVVVNTDGKAFIVSRTKRDTHALIEVESGNRWSDDYDTIETIEHFISRQKWSVYRGCKVEIKLGKQVMSQGEFK